MDRNQTGFSLLELLITMTVGTLLAISVYSFVNVNTINYLHLQNDATGFADLASQSQRIASVTRGATGIVSATGNDLVLYAYFFPSDTYVSLVHYYLSSDKSTLYADVTPMTSNPPQGTPITSSRRTYTVITNFYQPSGGSLFTYLDASFAPLTVPISDLNAVKGIQVNLAENTSGGGNQSLNLQLDLRNRKTNL